MSAPRGRLLDALEPTLVRILFRHLEHGDLPRSLRRAERLSRIAPRLLRRDWNWIRKSLRLVYGPQLDEGRCRRLASRVYLNFLHTLVESLHSTEVRTSRTGFEHLRAAHERGRGVIACGMHLGSWDVGLKNLSETGLRVGVVYRPAPNPRVHELIHGIRASWAVDWIHFGDVRPMLRFLKRGHVLCILCDQVPGDPGVTASFLGVDARFPQGPARLGLLLGSPLVPVVHVREEPGRVTVHCEAPIDPDPSRSADRPASDLTARIARVFEPWVIEYSEQYNWCYPIWRQKPGGGLWRLHDPDTTIRGPSGGPFPPLSGRVSRLIA